MICSIDTMVYHMFAGVNSCLIGVESYVFLDLKNHKNRHLLKTRRWYSHIWGVTSCRTRKFEELIEPCYIPLGHKHALRFARSGPALSFHILKSLRRIALLKLSKPINPKTENLEPEILKTKVEIAAYIARVFVHFLVTSIWYCLDVLFGYGRTSGASTPPFFWGGCWDVFFDFF